MNPEAAVSVSRYARHESFVECFDVSSHVSEVIFTDGSKREFVDLVMKRITNNTKVTLRMTRKAAILIASQILEKAKY